jgi:hypothetical protein
MFFHSSNGEFKKYNEQDCKIVVDIETREGFESMHRIRFNDGVEVIAYASELKGKRDDISDAEREASANRSKNGLG